MKIIDQVELSAVDISTALPVVEYKFDNLMSVSVSIKLTGISLDGGDYSSKFSVDGALVVPTPTVMVPGGVDAIFIQGPSLLLLAGQTLSLALVGTFADRAVSGLVTLVDVSPIGTTEVVEIIEPEIRNSITTSLRNTEITVRPTKTILGPCKR